MNVIRINTDKPLAMCVSEIEFLAVLVALDQYLSVSNNKPSSQAQGVPIDMFDSGEDPDTAWSEGYLAADEEAKTQMWNAAESLRSRMAQGLDKMRATL